MNKLDFLRRLDKELSVLDRQERREILGFYEERFYNGTIYENKTEEEVIAELERPEVIARNVLAEYGVSPTYVKTKEERYTNISTFKVIMLLAFDVLIATSVIPALYGAAIAILGSTFSYISTWGLMIGAQSTVDEFVFAFLTGGYILLFLFGLVVLEAALWATRTIVKWHLNVFKFKNRDKTIKKISHWSLDSWFKKHRRARTIKNLALIGAIITVSYTGFWLANHYDWVEAEYSNGEIINETITEDFTAELTAGDEWDIITTMENIDIDVVLVAGEDVIIKHSYYEDDEFEYEFDFENNELVISNNVETQVQIFFDPSELFNLFNGGHELRIEVPQELVLNEGSFTTSNKSVDITNVDFNKLTVKTSNSRIDVTNLEVGTTLKLTTTNSTIDVSNVIVGSNMTLDTSNGRIDVNNVVSETVGSLVAETSNGTVSISNVNFGDYDIDTSNGRIRLENINEENYDGVELNAKTSNSNVSMSNVYVDDITIDTTNGNIYFDNDDTSFHPSNLDLDTSSYNDIDTNVHE